MERRFKGQECHVTCFRGNKYDWTKSWGSAIANVQQLFVLLILYLSMNTDRKCWTLWDMNFRFGDNLFSLSSKCQDSYTIQSRHHADQSPATDLRVHQYTYWELDWIGLDNTWSCIELNMNPHPHAEFVQIYREEIKILTKSITSRLRINGSVTHSNASCRKSFQIRDLPLDLNWAFCIADETPHGDQPTESICWRRDDEYETGGGCDVLPPCFHLRLSKWSVSPLVSVYPGGNQGTINSQRQICGSCRWCW